MLCFGIRARSARAGPAGSIFVLLCAAAASRSPVPAPLPPSAACAPVARERLRRSLSDRRRLRCSGDFSAASAQPLLDVRACSRLRLSPHSPVRPPLVLP